MEDTMARLPASQYFDLSQPFRDLQEGELLHAGSSARRSRAFDIVNARLFAAQLTAAGRGTSVGVERVTRRGGSGTSCAIDPVHERVAVRRSDHGGIWYTVYELSQAMANDFGAVLARFPQPVLSDAPVTFQSYAILGQYLYTLDREARASGLESDSYVARIDMNTGQLQRRSRVRVAAAMIFREPEGMAISRARDGRLRILIGFGSRDSLDGPKRYTNVYYNDVVLRVA
jgi:hypothetical protein